MRTSDSSPADWFVISVRWLTILGLTVSLSLHGRLVSLPGLLLTEEVADRLHHAAGIG